MDREVSHGTRNVRFGLLGAVVERTGQDGCHGCYDHAGCTAQVVTGAGDGPAKFGIASVLAFVVAPLVVRVG